MYVHMYKVSKWKCLWLAWTTRLVLARCRGVFWNRGKALLLANSKVGIHSFFSDM
jgi:hypothetical protein